MAKFDFDKVISRHGTDSVKWDMWPDREVLPLWVADMDFETAPAVVAAIERRARHGIYGYTHPGDDYYDAITRWFLRRHNWIIHRDDVLYTTGVVPATTAVIKGLTQPGDGVVVMTPVYTCFYSSIRNTGCVVIGSSLQLVNDRYSIDFDNLEQQLSQPHAKIMLLCNPHNPGGSVWTADELARVDELCARHGVTVVSDEIHCEIVMPGNTYTPFATVATRPYVAMVSPSKAFNTAGLHTANIVVPDAALRARIDRAINDNETCDIGPFGIEALKAAYNEGEEWLDAMISYVADNYRYLCGVLADVPGVRVLSMQGTYLAWVDVRNADVGPVEPFCEHLRACNKVWLHPGTMYGPEGEGFIRINLATSRTVLTEAMRRFTAALTVG